MYCIEPITRKSVIHPDWIFASIPFHCLLFMSENIEYSVELIDIMLENCTFT